MKSPIILALDGMDEARRQRLMDRIDPRKIWGVKFNDALVGNGIDPVYGAKSMGFRVMADPKFHDIPNTVGNGMRWLVSAGADFITVHASGGSAMIAKAVEVTAGSTTRVLAVTILTSMDEAVCREIYGGPPDEVVPRLARIAVRGGAHGIVCSPRELSLLAGPEFSGLIKITPGVRSPGAETHDQSRIATPAGAIEAGASFIVVGREVTEASDPVAAIQRINRDLGVE